jgi:hypothetical protein
MLVLIEIKSMLDKVAGRAGVTYLPRVLHNERI